MLGGIVVEHNHFDVFTLQLFGGSAEYFLCRCIDRLNDAFRINYDYRFDSIIDHTFMQLIQGMNLVVQRSIILFEHMFFYVFCRS